MPASLIKENLARQLNCEIGVVLDLIPLQRGASGRITELKIVGSERYLIIGKELLIRKILSESHLKSSAFVVDKKQAEQDIFFDLHGAGWGHGVGLCQIGAAVMGEQGYSWEQILKHYFKNTSIETLY